MNKKVYLQGDGTEETGKKIIEYLESLGGVNSQKLLGKAKDAGANISYYIHPIINIIAYTIPPDDYKYLDVNLILNKKVCFKAKVGDIEYNLRIIRYLESIGGYNRGGEGNPNNAGYYYIGDNSIGYTSIIPDDYILSNIDDYVPIKGDLDHSSEECFKIIIENMKKNGVKVKV